jgi:hypothetical protein
MHVSAIVQGTTPPLDLEPHMPEAVLRTALGDLFSGPEPFADPSAEHYRLSSAEGQHWHNRNRSVMNTALRQAGLSAGIGVAVRIPSQLFTVDVDLIEARGRPPSGRYTFNAPDFGELPVTVDGVYVWRHNTVTAEPQSLRVAQALAAIIDPVQYALSTLPNQCI